MFKPLNPLLNSELRLAIISLLMVLKEANFNQLKEKTAATAGNLSVQLKKLEAAGYIQIHKTFKGSYPLTSCKITDGGIQAFEEYVDALKSYINLKK